MKILNDEDILKFKIKFVFYMKMKRIKKGLTQKELSKLCDIRHQQISDLEKGRNINLSSVLKIASCLSIPISKTIKESLY